MNIEPLTPQSKPGEGFLQWNPGSWFGTMLGSSSWLVAAALLSFRTEPTLALILAGCFAVVAMLTVAVWRLRDQVSLSAAFLAGFTFTGVVSILAIGFLQGSSLLPANDPSFRFRFDRLPWVLAVYGALAVGFGTIELWSRHRTRQNGKKKTSIQDLT